MVVAEPCFTGRQIEFPHPAEAFVVKRRRLFPPRHEAVPPGFQRFGIVKAEHFDIRDDEPRPFNLRNDFRKRRNIAPWEYIFGYPRVRRSRRAGTADRMDQRHAIRIEQVRKLGEVLAVVPDTDMLEHADRHDPIKAARLVAIIAQIKADPVM